MDISRRKFLHTSLFIGFALATKEGWANKRPLVSSERRDLFPQGVASGDPTPDSVILWTRRPPMKDSEAKQLTVEISKTPDFKRIYSGGTADISADSDWTCHFLATDLKPNREYWYRFVDEHGFASRIGRTITAPGHDSDVPVRFTFVSCQCPNEGAMNAYRKMIYEDEARSKDQRLNFVLHLGDFIYEVTWYSEDNPDGNRGRRIRDLYKFPQGRKVTNFYLPVTLEDYRTLYRAYLTDPDLQDARARWPFVCVWDNHEFAWAGYQSQYVAGGGYNAPAQSQKVFANQAWWEFIPAMVQQPGNPKLEKFIAPVVKDIQMEQFNDDGLCEEPNNLIAINSLKIQRVLRWGKNVDLLLTDNWSFRSPDMSTDDFTVKEFPRVSPQVPFEIMNYGRHFNHDNPPDTIRFDGKDIPNPTKDVHAQTFLGSAQRKWFLEQLGASTARWKIWGHGFGLMDLRSDYQNIPGELGTKWPKDVGYALIDSRFLYDKEIIYDFIRDQKIAGFCVVGGDRHGFYAGVLSKELPPKKFEPLGVEFITGSISQQTLFEVVEVTMKKDNPKRWMYLVDQPDGKLIPSMNTIALHGVLSALKLKETGDMQQARAVRNPDVAPHLKLLDQGGHGYALVTATSDQLSSEFVCIPRPLEKSDTPDGGPLLYRVVHRTKLWKAGETPMLEQEVVEGNADYCI
jgi:alkaline phosphatase D